jgi:hypothetical protein
MNLPFGSFADLVRVAVLFVAASNYACAEGPRAIDDARAQSSGIRKISGKHLELFTDVPSSPEVDRLPEVFDRAVPQWAAYFGIDPAKTAQWRPRAYLVADRRRFESLVLLPADHEEFENGITIGSELWLRDQPTDYYRRHLLLHEGTHAFMIAFLGSCGPGWYMEGTAELLGTHAYVARNKRLTLNVLPRGREEVPMLGRIKLIEDARDNNRVLSLPEVLALDGSQQLGNEAYAWCWAVAKLLDSHPRYRDRFRQLRAQVKDPDFNDLFRKKIGNDWADLNSEWQAYIATLDYGYDFDHMAIDFERGKPLAGQARTATIAADRGWQSSGAWLEAGKSYNVTATGRFQIAAEEQDGVTKSWPCEPGGVTIDYHDGRPLGILLGAIDYRDKPAETPSPTFANPASIGLRTTLKSTVSGTLYLRVNDSPARLHDNRGTLVVKIEPAR